MIYICMDFNFTKVDEKTFEEIDGRNRLQEKNWRVDEIAEAFLNSGLRYAEFDPMEVWVDGPPKHPMSSLNAILASRELPVRASLRSGRYILRHHPDKPELEDRSEVVDVYSDL